MESMLVLIPIASSLRRNVRVTANDVPVKRLQRTNERTIAYHSPIACDTDRPGLGTWGMEQTRGDSSGSRRS